jgi:hypothetical protein
VCKIYGGKFYYSKKKIKTVAFHGAWNTQYNRITRKKSKNLIAVMLSDGVGGY